MVRVIINAQGQVTNAEVIKSSGFPRLDKAAIESAYKMRCAARTEGGRPVESTANKPFSFTLNN